MNPLKRVLFILGIPLLLTGCGDAPEKAPEKPPGKTTGKPSAVPEILPSKLKIKRQSQTYVITGFGMRGSKKAAIINGKVVIPGAELDPGVLLKDIHPTFAIIVHGNTEYMIRPENIQTNLDRKKQ